MEINVEFPDPKKTDDEGLVAIGGELSVDYLIAAYSQGVFPWFNEDDPILWWSPNPRMVLFPEDFKLSKSLKQIVNSNQFELRIDCNFEEVIRNCQKIKRKDQGGTWISDNIIEGYIALYNLGIAHSFETYIEGELVGGLYGVSLGKAFFGESMFFAKPNASKVAFYYLVEWCKNNDFHFIDAQQSTNHLKSLGAKDISRDEFLERLDNSLTYGTIQGKWTFSPKSLE